MKSILLLFLLFLLYLLCLLLFIYIFYTVNLKNEIVKMKKKAKNGKNGKNEKNKIAIVTLETRNSEMLSIHNNNIQEYCKLHDYVYIFKNTYENKLKLPIYWKKLQLVKDILENNDFDYVLWMDSDTLINDMTISLENILESNYSIYMGKDLNTKFNLNAGVFVIKNDKVGLKFLTECIEVYINRDSCKDEFGNYALNGEWSKECYEQGVMNELIKTKYFNNFKLLDEYIVLNTFIPNTTSFILHLCGGIERNREEKRNIAFRHIIDNNNYFDKRIQQLLFLIKHYTKAYTVGY